MNFEMQKANMLADNMNSFITFVNKNYENDNRSAFNKDKLYQIKCIMEDFKFQILADELHRINQFDWDEKYTHILVDSFVKGFKIIDEYAKNNYNDLFMLTGRIHILKNLSLAFRKIE